MKDINVCVIGVGNCASAFVQAISCYKSDPAALPGLPFPDLGGYTPGHINLAAAIDIDARKVGEDVSAAIFAPPNCTTTFYSAVPHLGVDVFRGCDLDGISPSMQGVQPERRFEPSKQAEPTQEEVVQHIVESGAQVVLNFLPVGSQLATEFYATCALEAGAAFVNGMPVFLASDQTWARRFENAGLPLLGDDFKSQVGATIVQRALANLFGTRGAELDRAYQLNVGGNTDFLNMVSGERLASKRHSKTEAVQTAIKERLDDEDIRVGPSDYVPWLNDQKVAYLRLEGKLLGGAPVDIEVRMSVQDSPNAAAMALAAVRCAQIALDRGLAGSIDDVCSFLFKHPPRQHEDGEALGMLERFVERQPRLAAVREKVDDT